jgi:hypothetical protein
MVGQAVFQRFLVILLSGFGCLWLSLTPAIAQGVDELDIESEEDFLRGVGAYESGQYEEAIVSFQRSFRAKHRPNLAFNIAMSFERLKDVESAAAWFRQYRKLKSVDELGIEARLRSLEVSGGAPKSLGASAPVNGEVNPYKATALGVGVIGIITASILGSMALYHSGRSEETSDLRAQGTYARHAEGYAISTDVTLLLSVVGLVYGGSSLFEPSGATD